MMIIMLWVTISTKNWGFAPFLHGLYIIGGKP